MRKPWVRFLIHFSTHIFSFFMQPSLPFIYSTATTTYMLLLNIQYIKTVLMCGPIIVAIHLLPPCLQLIVLKCWVQQNERVQSSKWKSWIPADCRFRVTDGWKKKSVWTLFKTSSGLHISVQTMCTCVWGVCVFLVKQTVDSGAYLSVCLCLQSEDAEDKRSSCLQEHSWCDKYLKIIYSQKTNSVYMQ